MINFEAENNIKEKKNKNKKNHIHTIILIIVDHYLLDSNVKTCVDQ